VRIVHPVSDDAGDRPVENLTYTPGGSDLAAHRRGRQRGRPAALRRSGSCTDLGHTLEVDVAHELQRLKWFLWRQPVRTRAYGPAN